MSTLDGEFEIFKARLITELQRMVEARSPSPAVREKWLAEIEKLQDDRELRANFVRDVFAGNEKLADVQGIRQRLRGK